MERGLDLAPPVVEELEQHREIGRQVIFLPDEQLEQRRCVGSIIMQLRRGQAIAVELGKERAVAHWRGGPAAPDWASSERSAAKTSSTGTARRMPGGLRNAGCPSTADRSDAQRARMAR